MLQEAAEFIQERDDFLLLTHVQPDGDAYGSTLGMAHLLQTLGKRYTIANEDPVVDKFRFLPMSEKFQLSSEITRSFSHVIALDCGDIRRLGESAALLADEAEILNIDHHKTNDLFGRANLVDLEAAATSQIVFTLAKHLELDLNIGGAICLYTGILTDTGGFRYSNTTVEVHQIVAGLLDVGINPFEISDRVLESLTWNQVQLIREALGSLQRDESGKVAWLSVSRPLLNRLGASDEDAEGLVSYARNVQGVEVGILFREKEDGSIKVSLRSKYRVDVGEIALSFGGGGHARAAGCTMPGPAEQVQLQVLTKVREAIVS
jgi:phosphoesterase RecJ-like protein